MYSSSHDILIFLIYKGVKAEEVIKAASMLGADSKERQLARLLHEIDLLKDQNRKVSWWLPVITYYFSDFSILTIGLYRLIVL